MVESDEQILVGVPDDGHMALYEVCYFMVNILALSSSQYLSNCEILFL